MSMLIYYYRSQGTYNNMFLSTVPPQIESPAESRLEVTVGKDVKLPCVVDGFPKPDITWIFYSSNSSVLPRKLKYERFKINYNF